ncbi:hypothetical protein Fmac_022126 [Flemingia macrophylla]|uniref:Uncharacterized protein n=1 Tax=Flemingia macrophylla TaxID=520843 RepID=A0ABD1LYT7_9FABA
MVAARSMRTLASPIAMSLRTLIPSTSRVCETESAHTGLAGSTAHMRHPPSPPEMPIIGHLQLLKPLIHQAFRDLSLRFGPLKNKPSVTFSMIILLSQFLLEAVTRMEDV